MSINPTSSVAAAAAAASSSSKSALAAATEEATETKATTVKEAQNGDRIAQRKLRALEAKQKREQPKAAPAAKASEPGKGTAVDHDA